MKIHLPISIGAMLALVATAPLAAQEEPADPEASNGKIRYVLILPQEKAPETVKATEPNPFASTVDSASKEAASSEDTKLRDILAGLQIGGRMGNTILLGDIVLRENAELPELIPSQQAVLKVHSITADAVTIVWVEEKPTGLPARSFIIPVNLSPTVRNRLAGSKAGVSGPGSPPPAMGIFDPGRTLGRHDKKPALRAIPVPDAEAEAEMADQSSQPPAGDANPSRASSLLQLFLGGSQPQPVKTTTAPDPSKDAPPAKP